MNLVKLRFSMIGTITLLIIVSTVFFAILLSFFGVGNLLSLAFMVIFSNLAQWLFAPQMINSMYKVREIAKTENSNLHDTIERLSQRIGLKKVPKVMMANMPIPNAFAYGSPIGGNRVAVTEGLMQSLQPEEVEAVLGHELGHLKNKDVQTMMFASVMPAIFYFLGSSMMSSAYYGVGDRRRTGGAAPMLIGIGSMIVHYVLTLLTLNLSRVREYYADQRSVSIVDDGARKLSEALAKIASSSSKMRLNRQTKANLNSFKALFIEDPDSSERDEIAISGAKMFKTDQQLVQEILSRKVTAADHMMELMSTHPNIVKRLKALHEQ
ncbi:zinc metalloprotease HtpX [[Eubacterium] cellulosolvens]